MGKAKNRTKSRKPQSKAAKSRLLDDEEIKVENIKDDPKYLIEQALELFRGGDAQEAKKLAKRVVKVSFETTVKSRGRQWNRGFSWFHVSFLFTEKKRNEKSGFMPTTG